MGGILEYRLDSHTHTIASGHAYNTILEMARTAAEKGLDLLAITEHSMMMPGTCGKFYFQNLKVVPRSLFGIEVLFGTELNIMDFDGHVDMDEKISRKMDVCIASMHTPCLTPGTVSENTRGYLNIMDHPHVSIIGHPDDGRYPVDYDTLAAAAAEKHVLLEVNNHSLTPGCSRLDARENLLVMLERCMHYKTHIIMNSDAHWCGDIGNTDCSAPLILEAGFPEELIVNRSVEEYKTWLKKEHR